MDLKSILKKLDGASTLEDADIQLGYLDSGSGPLNHIISGDFSKGFPLGTIIEISGDPGTGKTMFITQAFIAAQKQGYHCVMIDNERAYNKSFAKKLGVDTSKLIYSQPITLEQCFDFAEKIVKALRKEDEKTPIIIGLDSIGTAPCNKEFDKDGNPTFGINQEMIGAIRAKSAGQCLRQFNALLRDYNATIIIINQLREKVGVLFGSPITTAGGGKALPFYASTRLRVGVGSKGILKNEFGMPTGIQGKIECVKSRDTVPFQQCKFKFDYNEGLDKWHGLAQSYLTTGQVEKNGAWFVYDGQKFHGEEQLEEYLIGKVNGQSTDDQVG